MFFILLYGLILLCGCEQHVAQGEVSVTSETKNKEVLLEDESFESGDASDLVSLESLQDLEPDWNIFYKTKSPYSEDKDRFVCVVFQNRKTKKRRLYVLREFESGDYRILVKNDAAILGEEDGGVWGDPFDGIAIDHQKMRLRFYGGSGGWRWSYGFVFDIDGENIVLKKCRYAYKSTRDTEIGFDSLEFIGGGHIVYYFPQKGLWRERKREDEMPEDRIEKIRSDGKIIKKEKKVTPRKIDLREWDLEVFQKEMEGIEE